MRRKRPGPKSTWTVRKKSAAEDKQAADAKHKDAMEAVREFNEARAKEKEPSDPQDGSQ